MHPTSRQACAPYSLVPSSLLFFLQPWKKTFFSKRFLYLYSVCILCNTMIKAIPRVFMLIYRPLSCAHTHRGCKARCMRREPLSYGGTRSQSTCHPSGRCQDGPRCVGISTAHLEPDLRSFTPQHTHSLGPTQPGHLPLGQGSHHGFPPPRLRCHLPNWCLRTWHLPGSQMLMHNIDVMILYIPHCSLMHTNQLPRQANRGCIVYL